MIIISEEDIICRSCANLINTLDRLEMEMKTVKGTVLRYLERKYSLDNDDELNPNDSIHNSKQLKHTPTKENKKQQTTPNDSTVTNNKKKLLTCDKCRYSTNHQTFMIHHLRQHINKKINCDKCGVQFLGNSQQNNSSHCCKKMKTNENVTGKNLFPFS